MTKFLMILGLVALVSSCGGMEEPQEQGPQTVGKRFALSDIKSFDKSEINSIKTACNALALKENVFTSQYAGKGVLFDFESEKTNCGFTRKANYKTAAKVEYSNGKMIFEKLARNAVIFDDVILRNFGPLKLFCDKLSSSALTKRYIHSGKTVNIVYGIAKGDKVLVAIENAFSYNSDGKYQSESVDKFLINNANNKYRGFVLKRELESTAGCSNNQKFKLTTDLIKVH